MYGIELSQYRKGIRDSMARGKYIEIFFNINRISFSLLTSVRLPRARSSTRINGATRFIFISGRRAAHRRMWKKRPNNRLCRASKRFVLKATYIYFYQSLCVRFLPTCNICYTNVVFADLRLKVLWENFFRKKLICQNE